MTFQILSEVIRENNIPEDVKLVSDSGWECDATDMDGIYYNQEYNTLVFTQGFERDSYNDIDGWKRLYRKER